MRNHKFKFILTFGVLCLCSFFSFVFASPLAGPTLSAAAFSDSVTNINSQQQSKQLSYTSSDTGALPFSVFTSAPTAAGGEYVITDYLISFTGSISANNQRLYTMDAGSIPYVVLSSNSFDELYFKTLFFKFNDEAGAATSTTINNMTVTAEVLPAGMQEAILLYSQTYDPPNSRYAFALNLRALTSGGAPTEGVECPLLNDSSTYLGGNGEFNDVSYRSGLYSFLVSYNFKNNMGVSNNCEFRLSFYVIDYSSFVVNGENPLAFSNTDTYKLEHESFVFDTDYELFNYNYENDPTVEYDATKFGLNFTFSSSSNDFVFNYSSFEFVNGNPKYTGKVNLVCTVDGVSYPYSLWTRSSAGKGYCALFDLKDFEKNVIIPHSSVFKTNSFQGTYAFALDVLIPTTESVNFIPIPSSVLDESIEKTLNCKRLAIFGYELKYTDYLTSQRMSLIKHDEEGNLITKTSVIAKNDFSDGYFLSIPDRIAITNQGGLRFDNFGNLTSSYTASYRLLDLNEHSENDVLEEFGAIKTAGSPEDLAVAFSNLDTFISKDGTSYTQGSPITARGIYIMKLVYSLSIAINFSNDDISFVGDKFVIGEQYMLFEVNPDVQKLKIQGIDANSSLLYNFNTYTNKAVRVGIEYLPNAFMLPISVTYSRAASFGATSSNSGSLSLKTSSGVPEIYEVDGKKYNYFVTSNANDYTFSQDGRYAVTIRINTTNTASSNTFTFYIDSDSNKISGGPVSNEKKLLLKQVAVSNALLVDGKYVKSNSLVSKDAASDIYITNAPFSLAWNPSVSGAHEYCYISLMEQVETTDNLSMFKENSAEYWLTNGHKFTGVLNNAEGGYVNSYSQAVGSELSRDSYFINDGLYYFLIYDQAGNSFYLIVLVDKSSPSILQGKWSGDSESSNWVETFNTANNESNNVNNITSLYFGTHKALLLPDISASVTNSVFDPSYTACYDLETGVALAKNNFTVDVYGLLRGSAYSTFVKQSSTPDLLSNVSEQRYYFLLSNTSVVVDVMGEDENWVKNFTKPSEVYRSVIYNNPNESAENALFKGQNNYIFTVTNQAGTSATRKINMNFDVVQGIFYAYNSVGEQYAITQGSGVNLNFLKFTYTQSPGTQTYYTVEQLYYDYYPFVLTQGEGNFLESSFPFSKQAQRVDLEVSTEGGGIFSTGPINVSYDSGLGSSGVTRPGKYVITRVYQGGTHKKVGGIYVEEDGGDYIKIGEGNKDEDFEYLFSTDSKTRRYTIYVDHNGIITSQENALEAVGGGISIKLGTENSATNQWTFKDFYSVSQAGNSLTTNRVPVQVNIPYSKYFLSTQAGGYLASNLNYAKLNVKITYSSPGANVTYLSNSSVFNASTGMLTCAALKGLSNPEGNLIFANEGRYEIFISDNSEVNPSTFSFVFFINYSSPTINILSSTYSPATGSFSTTALTNESSPLLLATNIKAKNDVALVDDNKILLRWSDPSTPYLAKIDKVTISTTNNDSSATSYEINFSDLEKSIIISFFGGAVDLALGSYANLVGDGFVLFFNLAYYNNYMHSQTFDGQDYYRYSYEIALSIEVERVYSINVSYVSQTLGPDSFFRDDNTSFADSTYSLTIDRTKPSTNLQKLMASENLLTQYFSDVQNFKEENYDFQANGTTTHPTSLSYAFGVPSSYALTYTPAETVNYFYVRAYEKFNGDFSSITPDMNSSVYSASHAYYENQQFFGGYPRFSEAGLIENVVNIGSETYFKIPYSAGMPLYNIIQNFMGISTPSGFYEIIEKDPAGNYRSFSVYFAASSNAFTTIKINGTHENGIASLSGNAITAIDFFTLSSLTSALGWGKFTLRNETLNTTFPTVLDIRPTASAISANLLSQINTFLTCEINTRFSITMARHNVTFPASTIYINVILGDSTAYLPSPTVQENTSGQTYNLILPTSTATTFLYLESFSLYIYENTSWQNTSHIYSSNVPKTIAGLQKGIYKAVYKDNYNPSTYSYTIHIGEQYLNNFSKEVVFSLGKFVYDAENDVYYSGGDVVITFESKIYQVKVNGVTLSGTSSPKYPEEYKFKYFTLKSNYSYSNVAAEDSVGGMTVYDVVYYDTTDSTSVQKRLRIIIFDQLPEILLTNDESGQTSNVTSTLEESDSQITNSSVNIDFGRISDCFYDELNDSDSKTVTSARLYSRNEFGIYDSFTIISPGTVVDEEGYYRLDVSNSLLGNTRSIYFVIQFGNFPLYTVFANDILLEPSGKEVLNLASTTSEGSAKFSQGGASQTIIKTVYDALTSLKNESYLKDPVETVQSQQRTYYDILVNNLGFVDGVFSTSNIGIVNILNVKHYYSIYSQNIVYNSNIRLGIVEMVFKNNVLESCFLFGEGVNPTPANVGSDYWTTIYLIFKRETIRIEMFAFTKVPVSTILLSTNVSYSSGSSSGTLTTPTTSTLEKWLTNNEVSSSTATISWNALPSSQMAAMWFRQGNFVYMLSKHNLEADYAARDFSINSSTNSTVISGSGTHKIMFKDLAGNTHQFTSSSFESEKNVFKILLIDQVIYYVTLSDGEHDPIQYGVFNGEVNLTLDQFYLSKLSNLRIRVTLNGTSTTDFSTNGNVYTFTQPGRYVVKLDAKHKDNSKDLNTATYTFTILNRNASRISFEYPAISGYQILSVIKDSRNITSGVLSSNGSLFVSATDSNSGSGFYTVTLRYGSGPADVLTFSFLISDYVPTISSNIAYGETTTSDIVLSYNAEYIYSQIGECFINILVYNSDSNTFYTYQSIAITGSGASGSNSESITLSASNSYFVQVRTVSGNVITSFRVNKTDPLNTFAIIAIVVASIAAIVLLFVIIKLRTRMKVR